MSKICTCCKAQKSLDEFYKDARRKDGRYPNCKQCAKESSKAWKQANPEQAKKSTLKSRAKESSKQAARDRSKQWRSKNPGHSARYQTARKQVDSNFKLIGQIRNLLLISFKAKGYKKNTKTEKIIGCSFDEFRVHIEKQFLDGMSWGNRNLWHIDHITPLRIAKTESEIVALNHHTNLQPLWKEDNLRKNGAVLYLI